VSGTIDVAAKTAKLLNAHKKVPMYVLLLLLLLPPPLLLLLILIFRYANVGSFAKTLPQAGQKVSTQKIWMNESRLAVALQGTQVRKICLIPCSC